MKHNYFFFVSTAILAMMLSAFTVDTVNMSNGNHKIELMKDTGGTRSATATEIEAFFDNHTLTVTIKNYTGMAWVDVTGMGGIRQKTVQINGGGSIEMNLYLLSHGTYKLCVALEGELYEGYFEY